MKKFIFALLAVFAVFSFVGCSGNDFAQMNYDREARTAQYQSDYARVVNKLEMKEGNFKTYRRVIFYNVRLGETVFSCEGYSHIKIDSDGDCEIVIKTGDEEYLRHYLDLSGDIIYFSEQLKPNNADAYTYRIMFNPKLWIPEISSGL